MLALVRASVDLFVSWSFPSSSLDVTVTLSPGASPSQTALGTPEDNCTFAELSHGGLITGEEQ